MITITLYSLPTCDKCKTLKYVLDRAKINYNEISDERALKNDGISEVPTIMIVGDKSSEVDKNVKVYFTGYEKSSDFIQRYITNRIFFQS